MQKQKVQKFNDNLIILQGIFTFTFDFNILGFQAKTDAHKEYIPTGKIRFDKEQIDVNNGMDASTFSAPQMENMHSSRMHLLNFHGCV